MKHILITTIAAVLVVGCGKSQQSAPAQEAKPVKSVAERDSNSQDRDEAEQAAPPTAKAPDISIWDAVKTKNIEAVKQHLDSGAGVNGKDEDGYTLLDWAIFTKDTETAEILRKHGGKHGTIHSAAYAGDIEAVKKFLAAGADVNANGGGRTPLDWAIYFKHSEIADLLRKHGGKTGAELKAEGK